MTIKLSSATAEKCTTGCELSFDFKETNLTVQNMQQYLSFEFDPVMTPPVVYNNEKYTPTFVVMSYYESIPFFSINGSNPTAVFFLLLRSDKKLLNMVIPIVESSNNQTNASTILSDILNESFIKAPKVGEQGKISYSGFSLQSIFPTNSPFFFIKEDTSIVFENSISINKSVLDKLKQVINPLVSRGDMGEPKVYYNPNGSTSIALIKDEEIYIDCQPVNSSEEKIEYVTKNPFKNDLSTILNDPTTYLILQLILSCIVFVVIYFILSKGFQYITLPQITPPKGKV